jgi:hypothetical protein
MARTADLVEFTPDARGPVLAAMAELAGAQGGWVNLRPAVDPDDIPDQGGTFRIFGAHGPKVPLCTWTPWEQRQRGTPRVTLGVQHGTGTKAVPYLARRGVTIDPRWRVLQDQSRRGLVVVAPVEDDADDVLRWLLATGAALCDLPYQGWQASIYRPR